jgi:hypothetical protein
MASRYSGAQITAIALIGLPRLQRSDNYLPRPHLLHVIIRPSVRDPGKPDFFWQGSSAKYGSAIHVKHSTPIKFL